MTTILSYKQAYLSQNNLYKELSLIMELDLLETIFKKLQECIKRNALNFSSVREEVLKIIEASDKALCSEEICKRVNERVQKKVSYNTVYRVLRLLEECDIVVTIQSDIKKTHYFLTDTDNNIYILDDNSVAASVSKHSTDLLKEFNLDNSNSFIVIHKK